MGKQSDHGVSVISLSVSSLGPLSQHNLTVQDLPEAIMSHTLISVKYLLSVIVPRGGGRVQEVHAGVAHCERDAAVVPAVHGGHRAAAPEEQLLGVRAARRRVQEPQRGAAAQGGDSADHDCDSFLVSSRPDAIYRPRDLGGLQSW